MDAEKYFNQSILRALDILEAVGKEERSLGLSELGRKVNLHKSTVHRLALSLESRGWLTREADSGKYRIGIKFLTLGRSANAKGSVKEIHPILARLSEETEETAILSVWDDKEVICVDKVETNQRVQISSRIGSNFPIHAGATGFAVLIGMPEEKALEILSRTELTAYTPLTITSPERITERYREMKRLGYVISTGQVDPGVTGIAMPIYFPYEQCYGSVGIVLPEMRAEQERAEQIIRVLKECTDQIRNKLNFFTEEPV